MILNTNKIIEKVIYTLEIYSNRLYIKDTKVWLLLNGERLFEIICNSIVIEVESDNPFFIARVEFPIELVEDKDSLISAGVLINDYYLVTGSLELSVSKMDLRDGIVKIEIDRELDAISS